MNLTDLMDLAGALLIVAALAVLVAPFGLAASLFVAGVGVIVTSILIDNPAVLRLHRKKKGGTS